MKPAAADEHAVERGPEETPAAAPTPGSKRRKKAAAPGPEAAREAPIVHVVPSPEAAVSAPLPPTPVAEAPVEGKGRHAVLDPLPVARLLGDAADTELPLSQALPPVGAAPEEDRRAIERRREEKARRRAERKRARAAALRPERGTVVGTITLRPEGYGFLRRIEGPPGDDVFLPPDQLHGVMDGDTLRVRIVRGKYGRDAGELLEVVSRRRRHLVGTFYRRGRTTWVIPVDPTLPRFVPVRTRHAVRDGQVVKVAITQFPDRGQPLLGDVERVIGNPGDPIVEVLEVAYAHGFAEDFPEDVRAEANRLPDRVLPEEIEGRRDLRDLRLVTIDGADARDFDDAVFVERHGRAGYRLVVAIADVAHYVRPGSRLDEEALHRATSVYFPNHVLPMLPERLSNGICSLNPHVDRLCMVADLIFDAQGRPARAEIYEGVMHSHARCTYEQVAKVLAGERVPELDRVREDLLLAGELASKLRARRIERGALDFDLPEVRPVLDEAMRVVDLVRRPRNDAHRMIEEFMLAANEAVARHFDRIGLPTVYRVHGEPDPEKLQNFVLLAQAAGFDFDLSEEITPARLGAWLRRIEGSPHQQALQTLLLRAMMQAIYTPENIGHFGLGVEHYLHFTSPIRRYPDLVVHRLLKEHWARRGRVPQGAVLDDLEARLEEIAAQSSLRERAAMEAEREIDAYFKCLFAAEHVGEVHGATIVSVTDFGFFAVIDEFPVEGLVRAEELGTHWEFDPRRHRLVFGNGRSFGVGERVQVEIAGVDLERRQIGFVLVADSEGETLLPTLLPPRRPRRRPAPPTWVEALPPRRKNRGRGERRWGAFVETSEWRDERAQSRRGSTEMAPASVRGGRFAAGDRQAAWGRGERGGRFATFGPPAGEGGRRKKGRDTGKGRKGRQRPGRRERLARRRRR